ncbi:hypothetical protein IMG5_171060 [Ichthyophthirius multifiliis]|uniref:Uncharacterized protein n=1 Tax=Ichthyophthirius multifiliis TaxID=5932 RepID=G0R1K3_ICHMU|nr:hypothetical protein IMG5_171060 [Ichthyophthirius multifiliis]EGR28652.1 hypothetical protein IMG5_171060 [Ichthyophthirius multifiliis]|eukprot:XP_004029888.1 hypothetical protein IMG5_171060 [Ichthyophthirius multifiliis]
MGSKQYIYIYYFFQFIQEYPQPLIPILPDCHRLFYKLQLFYKQENKAESIYLNPLHSCFGDMSKTLINLQIYGINYWKTPLNQNIQLMEDITKLINAEMIAENYLEIHQKGISLIFFSKSLVQYMKVMRRSGRTCYKKTKILPQRQFPYLLFLSKFKKCINGNYKRKKGRKNQEFRVKNYLF